MKYWNYCSLLLLTGCAAEVVVDRGQNVTLRCSYKVPSSGPLSSCWSNGALPYSGMCGGNPLIFSDGHSVTKRGSERYLLLGRLNQGDVSLTILNVSEEDAGTYGCRVDVPGWNNDQKHHIKLEVRQASEPTSSTASLSTSPDHMTTSHHMTSSDHVTRSDHVTSAAGLWTSPSGFEAEVRDSKVLLLCLLLSLVCIITTVILLLVRKLRLFKKMSENLSQVQFSSTASTLHLQQRAPQEENIYN